ncbi:hypothetical protein PSQ90_02860 [Devosia rhodophyticola]|uniref:Uncharacterized protein n=1 Tax=Devosia rhodophyticola TaxID=3026423 RepID=A0ABY7YYI8_9HYPH|nr:hypothetical protein [Devosia rhodophyticola]WDR06426.1 hypothetical protein PSQ90_02860 [Devosia rhodophyticola]
MSGEDIAFTINDGQVEFVLPRLHIHRAIVLDFPNGFTKGAA